MSLISIIKNFKKKEQIESKPIYVTRTVTINESAPLYKGLVKSGWIRDGDILTVESKVIKERD